MRKKPLSNSVWAKSYRERYAKDFIFRESEKERMRDRYEKKPKVKQDFITIDGVQYIGSTRYAKIAGISRYLLYRLIKDNVIVPDRIIESSSRYLFLESNAYLFRDYLHKFIKNRALETFERYDALKLKAFLRKYSGKYDPEKRIFINNSVTQTEKM